MIFHQIVYRFGVSPYSNGIYGKYELSTIDILDIVIALVALYHIMQLYSYIFQDKFLFFCFYLHFLAFFYQTIFVQEQSEIAQMIEKRQVLRGFEQRLL